MAGHDQTNVSDDEFSDIVEGLERVVPLILFIAGLLMYVGLRIKRATDPRSGSSEIPELFLALDILLVMLVPYLFQVILQKSEERTNIQKLLSFFAACGVVASVGTIARALIGHTSMLPVAVDYFSDEVYWALPLAGLTSILGAWSAKKKRRTTRR